MSKKWLHYTKYGILGVGVIGVAIGLPFAVINSKSYNLFAEIIVSDNTSVLADSSFSETTYDGFAKFVNTKEQADILPSASSIPQSSGVWRRPGDTTFARETTFRGLFASGKDMLIAPGFNHETAIRNVATDPKFSDKGFLLLDSAITNVTNVSSFIFRADQSGFLTGIAACIFLNNNVNIFDTDGTGTTDSLRVGAFVGMVFPSTMDFLAGFQAGVFAWNASITSTNKKNIVEWISLGTEPEDYASGDFGVGNGTTKARELLERGADVIMPIAGPQTADVVGEIIKQNKTTIVAGVDSAQELQTINKPLPLAEGKTILNGFNPTSGEFKGKDMIIQFSAVKHLDKATEKVLDAVFNPNGLNLTKDGAIGGFGYKNTGTIENETVGTSDNGLNQLLLDETFKTWVDSSNLSGMTIKWNIMKTDGEFVKMTKSGLFYHNGTGLLTSIQGAGGSFSAFTPLTNGTAVVEDIAFTKPVNPADSPIALEKLNGSKWVILR